MNLRRQFRRALAGAVLASVASAGIFGIPKAQAAGEKTADQIIASERAALEGTGVLDPLSPPLQAEIAPYEAFGEGDAPVGFVRLDNHKVTMAQKKNGQVEPYIPMGVELAFWDLRGCGSPYYTSRNKNDKKFSCGTDPASPFYKNGDYRAARQEAFRQAKEEYGFNTILLALHWAEWDKTTDASNPTYDFSLMDEIVADAKAHDLKVQWVLFFHQQTSMNRFADAGIYNIADEDGHEYGIQWANGVKKVAQYPANGNGATPELYPEYWHPVIHRQMNASVAALAEHFKDSETVMGYQVGNEEGPTGPYNNRQDSNPYRAAVMRLLQEQGMSERQALQHLGLAIWQHLAQSIREKDPYKFITTNFQSSDVEKNAGLEPNTAGGQNLNFYREAGLDGIAPMYYGQTQNIARNVDTYYGAQQSGPSDVAHGLPLFVPSEIGIGYERGKPTLNDMYDTLSRGGAGFGAYALGEMQVLQPSSPMRKLVKDSLTMFNHFGRDLWSSIPVSQRTTNNISLASGSNELLMGTLETDDPNRVIGMLYQSYTGNASGQSERPVTISVKEAGKYKVEAMVDGQALPAAEFDIDAGGSATYTGISMATTSGAVLRVEKIG